MQEIVAKILMGTMAVGSVLYGLLFFDFNLVVKIVPDYAKWVYAVIGLIGAYTLYTMFKTQ